MDCRTPSGLSLIEVVIALGLLSAVLISLLGLFVVAAERVSSGRASSQALAAATAILEETGGWSLRQTYAMLGFDGSARDESVSTRTDPSAARWRSLLDPRLANASAIVRLEALGPGAIPPSLRDAAAIRVRITVSWDEGARRRSVDLATVRM